MNSLQINTLKKLKGVKPSSVRRVGFFKLKKMYVYNFNTTEIFKRVSVLNSGLTRLDHALLGLSKGGVNV